MIAVAGGGTNAMDVSKNVRAWRCTRCPARLQGCCPGGGLQQPHARHPSPILEGLLSRYCLARGAFKSCCRSFMFVSFAWLRWCAYGAPARLADSASWISCFATTRWSVVTLDPGKRQMSILVLVDTTIEGGHPGPRKQIWRRCGCSNRQQANRPLCAGQVRARDPLIRAGNLEASPLRFY